MHIYLGKILTKALSQFHANDSFILINIAMCIKVSALW